MLTTNADVRNTGLLQRQHPTRQETMSILNGSSSPRGSKYNFSVSILLWLSVIALVEGNIIKSVKSDNVSCDFQLDMCSWTQDTHDLSDWARVTNGEGNSYLVSYDNTSAETIARIYSGLFSTSSSPTISLKHLMTALPQSQPPRLTIYKYREGEMFHPEATINYNGTLAWETTTLQITAEPGNELYRLVLEAKIISNIATVAVDDIVLTE